MTRSLIAVAVAFIAGSGMAQQKSLTGQEILGKVDDVLYAAKDKQARIRFVLTDKNGGVSERELDTWEKGSELRLMKFTSPADQKGIGFLSLPGEVMYVYLPAFKKTRRIASHVKNKNFAGTDLTYENLEPDRYSLQWNAKLVATSATRYTIELTAKEGVVTEYSKLTVDVAVDNFYPMLIRYYDKAGKHVKTLTSDKVEKVGPYWEARERTMEDHKTQHKTTIVLVDIKHDTNIGDEIFSERFLVR